MKTYIVNLERAIKVGNEILRSTLEFQIRAKSASRAFDKVSLKYPAWTVYEVKELESVK